MINNGQEQIFKNLCDLNHVDREVIRSRNRDQNTHLARLKILDALMDDYGFSLNETAKILNRDRTTIIYARRDIYTRRERREYKASIPDDSFLMKLRAIKFNGELTDEFKAA